MSGWHDHLLDGASRNTEIAFWSWHTAGGNADMRPLLHAHLQGRAVMTATLFMVICRVDAPQPRALVKAERASQRMRQPTRWLLSFAGEKHSLDCPAPSKVKSSPSPTAHVKDTALRHARIRSRWELCRCHVVCIHSDLMVNLVHASEAHVMLPWHWQEMC